jgi:hypothetical protein
MPESSINKSITIASEPDEEEKQTNTSFPDAVKELGRALHERYPDRTSNLTNENERGLEEIDVLNEYMRKNFGYQFETLNKLSIQKNIRVVSVKGFGVTNLIEIIKGIQTSFEQVDIPSRMGQLLRRP